MNVMNDARVKRAYKLALEGIGNDFVNELVRVAPVDTGFLRNSISYEVKGNNIEFRMAEYAFYLEFGCFFDENTLIKTKKGLKKLKNLKINDLVWTGEKYVPVIQKEKLEIGYPINKITIKTKNKELILTEDHPVLTKKGWKKAKDLKVTDEVCIDDGSS